MCKNKLIYVCVDVNTVAKVTSEKKMEAERERKTAEPTSPTFSVALVVV